MDQERSSKPKRKSNVYIKAGTMASLLKQRRSSFNQKSATACRPSNRESALSLIEEHPLPTPQDAGVAHVQTNSSTPPTEVVEEQVQSDSTTPVIAEQCEEQGPPVRTRKRGKTKMKSVHGRRDRKLILLNENDQPVGPTDANVMEFGSFLGTLARNATLCPLDILDWRFMDTKDDIWEYTKNKYDIPESGKKWALEAVDAAWRRHKYQLKRKHFRAYPTDELRMQNAPEDVPISQFKELLKYWKTDKLQKMSRIGSQNRKQLKNPHTCGKRSFAVVRHSMQSERDPSNSLSPKEIFVTTRKRKPGQTYKCLDEDTTNKIAEMEEIEKQQNEDGNGSINAFASVMGPEHPGRVRLYGRGVTKTSLKEKVVSFEPSSNDRSYLKNLEDKIQRLEEKMEEQKTTIRQEVVVDFLEQLHRFGHDIDPKVILAALGLSREASSTCAAVQPINHPSTSRNNDSQLSPGGAKENESSDEDLT